MIILKNHQLNDYSENYFIVAQTEVKRTILFSTNQRSFQDDSLYESKPFYIPLPQILFKIFYNFSNEKYSFRSLNCFFSKDYNIQDIFVPYLPNIDKYFRVCLNGTIGYHSFDNHKSFCEYVLSCFWQSTFHETGVEGCSSEYFCYGRNSCLSIIKQISNYSKQNPLWVPNETAMIDNSYNEPTKFSLVETPKFYTKSFWGT